MDSRVWWILAGVGALLAMSAIAIREAMARLTVSGTASRLGLSNQPDGPEDERRLRWLASIEPDIVKLAQRHGSPNARTTSGYRSDAVNDAVGGARLSRHRLGLALDVAWPGGDPGGYQSAARSMRDDLASWPVRPRTVIAEVDHLHIDFYDPFDPTDTRSGTRVARWLRELPGGGFAALG